MRVELGTEHDVTKFSNVNLSQQLPCIIYNRDNVDAAAANEMDKFSKLHIGRNGRYVSLNNAVKTHQSEHGAVGVVGYELSLTGKSHSVDTVRLEDNDGEIRADAYNYQRHKQLITARKFGNEEDACERCVHHTSHHASHSEKREVLFGHIYAYLIHVPKAGEEESAKGTNKQRGRECTSATSSAICGCCSKHLREHHKSYI